MSRSFSTLIYFLFFLSVIFSCATTDSIQPDKGDSELVISSIDRPIPYPLDVPGTFQQAILNGTRTADGKPGPNYWQNSSSYILNAEIDPNTHTLYGSGTVSFENNSPNHLPVVLFELAQNLHKEGTPKKEITEITGGKQLHLVKADGVELEPITFAQWQTQNTAGYVVEGTSLFIFPEEILESGSTMDFEFEWSFEVPQQGASGRMGRSRDNLYYIGYWYPHLAVFDDVYGWMSDPFLGNAEFYHGFADYDLTVTMPGDWLVMGTGEFLNPEATLSASTFDKYREAGNSDKPITIVDFDQVESATLNPDENITWKFYSDKVRDVAFSATRQSRWDGARTPIGDLTGNGETDYSRINTFFRESAPLWEEQTAYAQHSISFFSDYTSLSYPWPHMTSVEGADIIGGGMEFPMMTIIGDYNNAGAVRLYGVTAHELAHMWFPMILSTNERRYTWIDEGYTTFHTNEANMDFYGDRFSHDDVFSGYLRIAGTDFEGEMMRWSDFHYPGPAYGVASYPKPGSVLIALRGVLGDELFMKAHLELIERWAYKHPYPWDIFNTIEDVAGMDLSWFWRSWYYETWTLDQSISDVYEDGDDTVIIIEDLGNIPMPVHLKITYEDERTVEDTVDVNFWLAGNRIKELRVPTNSGVVSVEIDPSNNFPDINRQNNSWER